MFQEPILLVMLRIAAFQEVVPIHIIERVRELHPRSKPIIKKVRLYSQALYIPPSCYV